MKDNLVDSSVWIEYFKGNRMYSFITDLIYTNAICTNDIILTELLPSIIHKKENELADLLNSLRKNILIIDWQEIRNIQILNLKHGNNNVGISDIIIAQNCIQNELKLITNDKHFWIMTKYIPLKLYT
ncbi:MAG: PIN domain-containing protein [Spirochaetaceae bacterium]|jgi:predicted nucleic acid-binding protein|nr:PIN domain-containing protein [Spirochaetaceae bacterium]